MGNMTTSYRSGPATRHACMQNLETCGQQPCRDRIG